MEKKYGLLSGILLVVTTIVYSCHTGTTCPDDKHIHYKYDRDTIDIINDVYKYEMDTIEYDLPIKKQYINHNKIRDSIYNLKLLKQRGKPNL